MKKTPLTPVLALLGLTVAAFAHASEITDFPLERSMRARADVQAEARMARTMPGELYDGSSLQPRPPAMARSREAVRAEAIAAMSSRRADGLRRNEDLVGGM